MRILDQQVRQQESAVRSAERYLNLATNRYKLRIDSHLNVITAQTTYLSNRQKLVNLRSQRMTASVQLLENLGGGWEESLLPSRAQVLANGK